MRKSWTSILSILLVAVIVFNMLPLSVFAGSSDASGLEVIPLTQEESLPVDDTQEELALQTENVQVVSEDVTRRSEFYKEFVLSNGLRLATVYPDAIHFEENGEWKEIDNTLKTDVVNGQTVYTNTDGLWDVRFPHQLTDSNAISITKDGYTVSFEMAGELRSSGDLVVASMSQNMELDAANTHTISSVKVSSAQIQQIDLTTAKAAAEFEETVPDKLYAKLTYPEVYSNTSITYDLSGNRLKESVIIQSYDSALWGYRYELNTGGLIPVLNDDRSIDLCDPSTDVVVMTMPAPFILDANDAYCDDVEVSLVQKGDAYLLSYYLPLKWLAEETRAWPVVLDPVVEADRTRSNIRDVSVYETNCPEDYNSGILDVGHNNDYGIMRAFLKYDVLPELSSGDVVVYAQLTLYKPNNHSTVNPVEVHKVLATWESETMTWSNQPDFNYTVEDYAIVQNMGYYHWNITNTVQGWYAGENTGLMLKAPDWVETTTSTSSYRKQFYSSDYGEVYRPVLSIIFRNNNGLESYWDYTASSAGRAGTGYVNDYTGNLVWVRSDIGFGGNRMPVAISHIYNANDSTRNDFGLGYGWRTNYNQLAYRWDDENAFGDYYVWEDADGTAHYFLYNEDENIYKDEDGLELTLKTTGLGVSGAAIGIFDKYGNASYFDASGRLFKLANNQQTKSYITITYYSNTKKINTITDGVGRVYRFNCTNNLLTSIDFLGTGTAALSSVSFAYTGTQLTSITDPDGKVSTYGYTTNNLLSYAQDIDGYRISYTYNSLVAGKPNRISSIAESDDGEAGRSMTIVYGRNCTTFTDQNGNKQLKQFNNWGNTVSINDGQGRGQYAQYQNNDPLTDANNKANQLTLSSKLQDTVNNLLPNASFERESDWSVTGSSIEPYCTTEDSYMGEKSLRITTYTTSSLGKGVSKTRSAVSGKIYTFSAYVKTGTASVYLAISDGITTNTSEVLAVDSEAGWRRLEVSITAASETLTIQILSTDMGRLFVDCVQLEQSPTASRYNLMEGDFDGDLSNWTGVTRSFSTPPAPQLGPAHCVLSGSTSSKVRASQTVQVSGNEGDNFVVAGWAKGYSVPIIEDESRQREFGIIISFLNGTTVVSSGTVRFNPCVSDWQYASGAFIAGGDYTAIQIELAYDYNANTVYFDGIQLYKETFGQSYVYDDDGNVTSVTDLQKQTTAYEYTENDLTKAILPTGSELTYTYDEWHNVETATTAEGITYSFTYDTYGNNTAVSILYGESSITCTAGYTSDGNRLEFTTDTKEDATVYSYNADTNLLECVQAPEDSLDTATTYTYDAMYRLASVSANVDGLSESTSLTATYGYTDDLLTSLSTGSTTYTFAYGDFAQRSSIKIGSRTLAAYEYSEDENHYLSALDFGNGDRVQYSYDEYGRLVAELYEDGDKVTYKYDNSGGLASVHDSATGYETKYYYDFTDRLARYTVKGTSFNHSVAYTYDKLNNLTALQETINGATRNTNYTYDKDNRIDKITNGENILDYTYDDFGQLEKRVLSSGETELIKEELTYPLGDYGPWNLIDTRQLTTADKTITHSYSYTANGNISSVTEYVSDLDSEDSTVTRTNYSYDTQNQLIREDNQAAGKTWVWTYDNAGNITSKKEYAYTTGALGEALDTIIYTYGDSEWGDLLTGYDGEPFYYDAVGNLVYDDEWDYTWEHGRQLASMSHGSRVWTFTYDANGLRTSRTYGTDTYTYVYNGGLLSRMTVGDNVLDFAYDASGTPMTVTYNGATYYYVTSIQGDVIAILNSTGNTVATYRYDAWGNILSQSSTDAIGSINPLRYRGYVYDGEMTNLYYLQSRYYNPETGRFISADAFASTGQGLLGNNMFAYCNNNPVNCVDPTGQFLKELWNEFAKAIQQASGSIAAAVGIGQIDSPLLGPADVVSIVTVTGVVMTCAGIAISRTFFATPTSDIFKTEEKEELVHKSTAPYNPVIFPLDPNTFNPVGLVKVPRAGTRNGMLISWMDPVTNTEVFRWDENPNYSNGPHYHVMGMDVHFYPGISVVPEPFASLYFPYR